MQGIAEFSHQYIGEMRELLDIGTDVRHISQYQGIFMLVGDKKESLSFMGVDTKSLSVDIPIVALWSDNPPLCLVSYVNLQDGVGAGNFRSRTHRRAVERGGSTGLKFHGLVER